MKIDVPAPEFIIEQIPGAVYLLPDGATLTAGAVTLLDEVNRQPVTPTISGIVHLRYGISMAQPETAAIMPGLFISERGVPLVGIPMWNFMIENFPLYPRSDVQGLHSVTGEMETIFLRDLDFGRAIRIFAYAEASDTIPMAEITRLILPDGADVSDLPLFLKTYARLV